MTHTQSLTPHIRQCANPDCVFRFPVTAFDKNFEKCPKCGAQTEFQISFPETTVQHQDLLPKAKISFLLDNLRSVFNVGSIFRSADGCGIVNHLYLCGTTPSPEHPKMAKTALGAEKTISWSYHPNGLNLTQELVKEDKTIVALEMTQTSMPISEYLKNNKTIDDIIFIVGNEVTGVDPEILSLVEQHTHLPMHGIKESLNVAIAASILCYSL